MSRFDRILRRTDRAAAEPAAPSADPGAASTAVLSATDPADATRVDAGDGTAPTSAVHAEAAAPTATSATETAEVPSPPRRGRVRRRLRQLRAARELLLRDLGGLVYELHRRPSGSAGPGHDDLVERKVQRLQRVDAEIRELRDILDTRTDELVVRHPGIGGACPSCGELHAADARFCSRCGTRVDRSGASDARVVPSGDDAAAGEAPGEAAAAPDDSRITVNAGDAR